jgi:hypothetical protein
MVSFTFSSPLTVMEWRLGRGYLTIIASNLSPYCENVRYAQRYFAIRVKRSHNTPWRHREERRYSSYSFTTSALDRDEWSASHPFCSLPQGKDPWYPLDTWLGGPQSWFGHKGWRKNPLASAGDRTSIAQTSSL